MKRPEDTLLDDAAKAGVEQVVERSVRSKEPRDNGVN